MKLIVTADDFGRSQEINRAVLRAHREGVLTCASLMVAGEAVEEAVEIARQNPALGVGLHLVAVDGPAVLRRESIPDLVDDAGQIPNSPISLGIQYSLQKRIRDQLKTELDAQFQRFASFSLPLSHVDGHQHMHLHPAVFPIVVPLARRFGARGIRIVRDPLWIALRHDRSHLLAKLIWKASFAWMSQRAKRRLEGDDFVAADRVFGLMQSGHMTAEYVIDALQRLSTRADDSLVEMYFHPTLGPRLDEFGPNPGELETLCNPRVRQMIEQGNIELVRYAELHKNGAVVLGRTC